MILHGSVSTKVWFLLFTVALGLCILTGNQIRQVSQSPLPGVLPVVPLKFELVWTQTKALSLIKTWGTDAVGRLRLGLYWDFTFIPDYILLLKDNH
jgi:hypothetical protein